MLFRCDISYLCMDLDFVVLNQDQWFIVWLIQQWFAKLWLSIQCVSSRIGPNRFNPKSRWTIVHVVNSHIILLVLRNVQLMGSTSSIYLKKTRNVLYLEISTLLVYLINLYDCPSNFFYDYKHTFPLYFIIYRLNVYGTHVTIKKSTTLGDLFIYLLNLQAYVIKRNLRH